jgi:hypothetical protein
MTIFQPALSSLSRSAIKPNLLSSGQTFPSIKQKNSKKDGKNITGNQ